IFFQRFMPAATWKFPRSHTSRRLVSDSKPSRPWTSMPTASMCAKRQSRSPSLPLPWKYWQASRPAARSASWSHFCQTGGKTGRLGAKLTPLLGTSYGRSKTLAHASLDLDRRGCFLSLRAGGLHLGVPDAAQRPADRRIRWHIWRQNWCCGSGRDHSVAQDGGRATQEIRRRRLHQGHHPAREFARGWCGGLGRNLSRGETNPRRKEKTYRCLNRERGRQWSLLCCIRIQQDICRQRQ